MLLGLVQGFGAPPIAATVEHALVEHRLEQIVTEIVVMLGDLEGARASLEVHEPRLQREQDVAGRLDAPMKPGAKSAADHFRDLFAVPPTVHVAFADAELALGENPGVERFVVDLNVPRTVAVDPNIGDIQNRFQSFSIPLRTHVKVVARWPPES